MFGRRIVDLNLMLPNLVRGSYELYWFPERRVRRAKEAGYKFYCVEAAKVRMFWLGDLMWLMARAVRRETVLRDAAKEHVCGDSGYRVDGVPTCGECGKKLP